MSDVTKGFKLLGSLFSAKGFSIGEWKKTYDFASYFFYEWCNNGKNIPELEWKRDRPIYREFIWRKVFTDVLESKYMKQNNYNEFVNWFRIECVRACIEDICPEFYDELSWNEEDQYIMNTDISDFMQMVTKYRIRSDEVITNVKQTIYLYMNATQKNFNMDVQEEEKHFKKFEMDWGFTVDEEGTIDWESINRDDQEVSRYAWFDRLEKENWKRNTPEKFHKYIESLNLTTLKELFTDPMWERFLPVWWQAEFLVKHSRFNFVAASRRAWKTRLGSYLAVRQSLLPMQSVIIIVPTKLNHARPLWKYLSFCLRTSKDYDMKAAELVIKNASTESEMIFYSAERADSVRGNAANLLLVDEAAFIDERVYETASALLRTTWGLAYVISTVNIDTPKNRFYYKLVYAEVEAYSAGSQRYGKRIDLYHNPFIPDAEKETIIKEWKRNPRVFNAEYMACFSDNDMFNLSNFWEIDEKPLEMVIGWMWYTYRKDNALDKANNYYRSYFISYDAAKLTDKPWVSVWGLYEWKADIVYSWYLPDWMDYHEQVALLMKVREMLRWKPEIIIDYRSVGVAIEEIMRIKYAYFPICVSWTGGYEVNRNGNIYNVWKDLCQWRLASSMELWLIKWFSFMQELRVEFEAFDGNWLTRANSADWKSKNHFDILASVLMWNWYAWMMWYLEDEDKVPIERQRLEWDFEWMSNFAPEVLPAMNNESFNEYERMWRFGY